MVYQFEFTARVSLPIPLTTLLEQNHLSLSCGATEWNPGLPRRIGAAAGLSQALLLATWLPRSIWGGVLAHAVRSREERTRQIDTLPHLGLAKLKQPLV